MAYCREKNIPLEDVLEIPQEVLEKISNTASGQSLVAEDSISDLRYVSIADSRYVLPKRIIDVVLAFLALLIIAIPMLIVFAVMYIDDPGKVLFAQYRVGMGGRRFKLFKLRTMYHDTPKYLSTSEIDDPDKYITRFGKFLRRFSIDELPQLINVLKGDMSLVGPRPLISDEHEIHALRMKFGVYKVRPGLTGLAQIHGRDMATPADKVRWDVRYLEKFGFWTDVKIIFSTIPKLFGGQGFAEGFRPLQEENKE